MLKCMSTCRIIVLTSVFIAATAIDTLSYLASDMRTTSLFYRPVHVTVCAIVTLACIVMSVLLRATKT